MYSVRIAKQEEYKALGALMVDVYSKLEGFPSPEEQPKYFNMLRNIGNLSNQPCTELLVAVSESDTIAGGVVYFSDMLYYGSGGTATQVKNASGFRLLAVNSNYRGKGIGKLLSQACIDKARADKNEELIIHTTNAMKPAWNMYEKMGFNPSHDLDFMQEDLQVFGFRLKL